jgi:D-arabinose 1-dehydrogenase-like Zn-dependent alcohol dehydrogenase
VSWKDVCKGSSDLCIASVGLYAIQFASLFGLEVVTTCSPNNNDLVLSHGAKYFLTTVKIMSSVESRKLPQSSSILLTQSETRLHLQWHHAL